MRRPSEHAQRNARNLFRHRCAPFCFPAAAQLLLICLLRHMSFGRPQGCCRTGFPKWPCQCPFILNVLQHMAMVCLRTAPCPGFLHSELAQVRCWNILQEKDNIATCPTADSHLQLQMSTGMLLGPLTAPGTSQEHPGVHLELQVGGLRWEAWQYCPLPEYVPTAVLSKR